MKLNKESIIITISLILLATLVGSWMRSVYKDELRALTIETNVEFFKSIEEAEKKLIFRKSSFRSGISNDTAFRHRHIANSNDSMEFGHIVIVEISNDSMELTEEVGWDSWFERNEFELGPAHGGSDSSRQLTISVSGDIPELSFDGEESFQLDLDSARNTLSGVFSNRLVGAGLADLQFNVVERVMDTTIDASFMTDAATLGNLFFGQNQYIATVDNVMPIVLRKMIPEIGFALFLFFSIAGSFVIVYRSLEKERKLSILKDDFVSNMTHELKTPISIVNVAIEALSNFEVVHDKEKTNQYLDISKHEMKRLDGLVDKILDMNKNSQVDQSKSEKINLHDTIQSVVRSMNLRSSKISVETNSPDSSVWMNPVIFKNIIYNLLDNAIKYDDNDGPIKVEIVEDSEAINVSVKDRGLGLEKDQATRIFEKFYRVPTFNRHNVKGHGLGLYYVKKHMSQMGGDVKAVSNGTGSVFILQFPKQ